MSSLAQDLVITTGGTPANLSLLKTALVKSINLSLLSLKFSMELNDSEEHQYLVKEETQRGMFCLLKLLLAERVSNQFPFQPLFPYPATARQAAGDR